MGPALILIRKPALCRKAIYFLVQFFRGTYVWRTEDDLLRGLNFGNFDSTDPGFGTAHVRLCFRDNYCR